MSRADIDSDAFRRAQLHSEKLRIIAVLVVIAVIMVISFVRVFVLRTVSAHAEWSRGVAFLCVFAAFELWVLRKLTVALSKGQKLSSVLWIAGMVFESSIPGFAIVLLASDQILPAYRPLATPTILLYFIFIILSTLKLSPRVCWLSGVVAAVSYIAAAVYLGWHPPAPGTAVSIARSYVGVYAAALISAGAVAGVVAAQIHNYLQAALREVETKSRLEAVQHDLQVARTIQQSLLPKIPPAADHFDIAGWNKPADDTGGDYFDWMTLDGHVVITMGDVTGHGLGPALLAAVCRAYSRATLSRERDLLTAFAVMNASLKRDLTPERFVTFVAAVCIPDTGDTEILSAGHGPLFVYSRSRDRFAELQPQTTPLGLFPWFNSESPARVRLEAGDLLLLATDGFFEWQDERGEEFGVQRMEDALRGARDLPSSEIIARLYKSVVTFAHGTRQADDLTAVLIKRL